MAIWHGEISLERLNSFNKNNLGEHLGIEFTAFGDDYLKAKMPVDHRTTQPAGLLDGGSSVALAERLGSIGGWMCVDLEKYMCVGLEINANHIRAVRDGYVEGIAKPLHIGRRTHVWEIRIQTPEGKLVCASRITLQVVEKTAI
ncbi:MAG: hotdog fold thioesterase [Calditrichia bacterium]